LTPTDVTRRLATFAATTSFDDLPSDVVDTLELAVLNMLGCCLGGVQTRIGRLHVEIAREFGGGNEQATVIGDGSKVSLPFAAYANGNVGFALDYEDMVFAVVHPGFATVGAGLPLAELRRASGRELLTAIAVGYEASTRIAMSMQPSPERARHVWGQQFHPFAAAAAAGRLLGLSAEQMDVAFGITATYATVPSVYKYFGPVESTRPMREVKQGWGWVCMAGLMAALSAERGFAGGLGALDGEFGFWSMAGSDRFEPERIVDGLGEQWLTREVEFKLHPSIGINHPAYLATRELVAAHDVDAATVEAVTITTPWGNLIGDLAPAGAVDAQFSLPYTVASTLARVPRTPELYADESLGDPAVRRLLARTEVVHDLEADRAFFEEQRIVQRVAIELAGGLVIERGIEFPRDRPAQGQPEIEAKFHELGRGVLDDDRRALVVSAVSRLAELDDAAELAALLAPPGSG
jgi:2-methylcitrate dehydratase PrpD